MKRNMKFLLNTRVLALAVAAATVASCGNYDYRKTETGLMYKIVHRGDQSKKIQAGQWLKIHYKATIGDSTLFDTYGRIPVYGKYDTSRRNVHDFIDFLDQMSVGDSAVFIRSVDTMQKRGYLTYNESFKPGGTIKGSITILAVLKGDSQISADQQKESELETKREVEALQKYLDEKKIAGLQKTPKGAFVQITQPGTGAAIDSGMSITVNYTGTLKNGTKFDSNIDSSFGHAQPYEFVVGQAQVIAGWDDAMKYFRQGGKGKIYIPAMLGYGGNAQGDKLPAYSDLIFDVEVVAVKPPASPETKPSQAPAPH
jgi:FKBP-type peptidyl-prolyl cis-trans isomerase FkpA